MAVTICKDSESSAKGHRVPYDKKRLDSAYCSRGQKCKGWEQPLGGLKSSRSPGVNEGVRYQRRCTTSFPLAPGHVIYLIIALNPFGRGGGTAVTRRGGTNIGCGTSTKIRFRYLT